MAKTKDKTADQIQQVEEALSKTEQFIEDNQKILLIVIGALTLIVLAYFGYKKMILQPKEKTAQNEIFMAERYFTKDSLDKALYGDGSYLGFIDIAKKYKITKTGKLASYYAGLSFLKQAEYEEALKYLKKYKTKSEILGPMAKGAVGDAYAGMEDLKKAANYYLEAAKMSENKFTAPVFYMKAGKTFEIIGENKKALEAYKVIKEKYPKTREGFEIDKYINKLNG